jgi:hypothetical protein
MWDLGVIGYQIVTTHQVAHAVERGFSPVTLGWGLWIRGRVHGRGQPARRLIFRSLGQGEGLRPGLRHRHRRHRLPELARWSWRSGVASRLCGVGARIRDAHLAAGHDSVYLFAGRHPGAILGFVHGGGGLGGFIGAFLGGWLFDVTGSYQLAFAAAALAITGSAVAAWVAAPRRSQIPDYRVRVPPPSRFRT